MYANNLVLADNREEAELLPNADFPHKLTKALSRPAKNLQNSEKRTGAMEGLRRIYRTAVPEPVRAKIRNFRNNRVRNDSDGLATETMVKERFELYRSKGLMFIHIPKAAGVSVFHALYGEDSWGHAPLTDFIDAVGHEEVFSVPRACMVRNPYVRLHSGYTYLNKGGRGRGIDLKRQELLRPFNTFEKFVKEYLEAGRALRIIHFKPQAYWVTDETGNLGVDYVGRLETIEDSFNEMVDRFGIDAAPLDQLNKTASDSTSREGDILKVFDKDMISIVNRVYADDFRMFNYPTL